MRHHITAKVTANLASSSGPTGPREKREINSAQVEAELLLAAQTRDKLLARASTSAPASFIRSPHTAALACGGDVRAGAGLGGSGIGRRSSWGGEERGGAPRQWGVSSSVAHFLVCRYWLSQKSPMMSLSNLHNLQYAFDYNGSCSREKKNIQNRHKKNW